MKNTKLLIVLALFVVQAYTTSAQTGWKWGVSSIPSYNPGMETTCATTDDSGNVFVSGFLTPFTIGGGVLNYIVYGTDTVYDFDNSLQQIVVKSDSNGNFLWAKCSKYANCYPASIVTDHSGNVYVSGSFTDSARCSFGAFTLTNTATSMYYLVKYSPSGNLIWAKNIAGTNRQIGSGYIGIDEDNNIYVSGGFDSASITIGSTTLTNSSASQDTFDVFLAKYDSLGNPVWAKSFGGHDNDYLQAMTVTPAGNIYLWGTYYSRSLIIGHDTLSNSLTRLTYTQPKPFFTKYDSSGNSIWGEGPNKEINDISQLIYDSLENIYMTGCIDSSFVLGHDTLTDEGGLDIFLQKYDSSGHELWAKNAGSPNADEGFGITLDNCNNVWIAGGIKTGTGSINFNGHTLTLATSDPDPGILAEYTADSGIYETSLPLTSGGDDWIFVMANKNGSIYVAGDYVTSYPLIFGRDTLGTCPETEELFIAKYTYDTIGCTPVIPDTIYVHTDTVVCDSSDAYHLTLKAPAGTNYRWYDGSTDSTHTESSGGNYWVSYLSAHSFIIDTFDVTFTRSSPPCPDRTDIKQIGTAEPVEVYPNPVTTVLIIKMDLDEYSSFSITNSISQIFYQQKNVSKQTMLDVKQLPPGLYYILFSGAYGTIVKKFVKA